RHANTQTKRDASSERPDLLLFQRVVRGYAELEIDVCVVATGLERNPEQAISQLSIDRGYTAGRERRAQRRRERRRHGCTVARGSSHGPARKASFVDSER